jgi:hypothetical protein
LNAPVNSQRADLVKPQVKKLGGVGPDGSFRSGVFEVTNTRKTGREGVDERVFQFGLWLSF